MKAENGSPENSSDRFPYQPTLKSMVAENENLNAVGTQYVLHSVRRKHA